MLQLSVAVIVAGAGTLASQATVVSIGVGSLKAGATVSTTFIVCVQLVLFPQLSSATKVRSIV
jgi:X-X-X-Leu-X-X-Gly heptad repeat protein